MDICRRPATKHSFLVTQALVTLCQRLAGQNTCSFAEIIHTLNLYVNACMRSWCNLPLLWGTKSAIKSVQKILDTNWIRIAVHYVDANMGGWPVGYLLYTMWSRSWTQDYREQIQILVRWRIWTRDLQISNPKASATRPCHLSYFPLLSSKWHFSLFTN